MYRLHGFFTQNSLKTLYTLEELGVEYEFVFVNLMKGEQRAEAFLAKNPMGKAPVLEHDGEFLSESGAICRYLANAEHSTLYPEGKMQRARVDQWVDYFTCHLGRALNTLFFEMIIKPSAGLGASDEAACEESRAYAARNFKLLDAHLGSADWLANDALSIADLFAFAYVEQVSAVGISLEPYPNVTAWFERMESRPAVARGRATVQPFLGQP